MHTELGDILAYWQTMLLWMCGLGTCFAVLSRFTPCNPGMGWWNDKRGFMTDLIYWLLIPFVLRSVRLMLLIGAAALLFGAHDTAALNHFFQHGYAPLGELPLAAQCALVMLLQDFYLYWMHRWLHGNTLWRVHAVHHSSRVLDWTSTQRFHPINSLLSFGAADIIILLMGFSPAVLVLLTPFNIAFSALVHANLRWHWGPFNLLLASPVFHRWHHTAVEKGGMRNFAPTFPFLDKLFGTYYMPRGELPADYGVDDVRFPQGFWGQFIYPFRRG